jgi:biotin transporter BioY
LLLLFINPIVAKTIGFYVSGFVEIFLISILILPEKNKKSILKTAIICLIAVIVAYLIFTVSLRIRCPRGVFNLF